MIQYADYLLTQWGIWCRSGRDKIGYPRQSSFARLIKEDRRRLNCIINDDFAMKINRVVQGLQSRRRRVVIAYYVSMSSCDAETISKSFNVTVRTIQRDIHAAHLSVMDAIR